MHTIPSNYFAKMFEGFNGNISSYGFGYEYDAASGSVWETDRVDYHYDPLNRLMASISSDGYRRFYRYAMGMFR